MYSYHARQYIRKVNEQDRNMLDWQQTGECNIHTLLVSSQGMQVGAIFCDVAKGF